MAVRLVAAGWASGAGLLAAALSACGDAVVTPDDPLPEPDPPAVPDEAAAWIEQHAVPFGGSHLSLPHDDLAFLRGMVGDARIVALGENTHGTRDFFEMKARILRYLVEEMGFDAFAIEATWPEANRLDAYVLSGGGGPDGGAGDPATLLSGLYFWTWNTESVLEMIEWIRAYNAEHGAAVRFLGFDMQYPGMAIHNAVEYVGAVDPDRAGEMGVMLDCLARFANDPAGRFPDARYRDQSADYRASCGTALVAARDFLTDNRTAYEERSGEEAFALALQSVRVARQYHLMIAGEQGRDHSMAENTAWLHERLGPDSRMVLWAHNYHVSTQPGAQGWYLRQRYGDDMAVFGFTHEAGTFTGVRQRGATYFGLDQMTLDNLASLSYEHYLSTAPAARFVLDLRLAEPGSATSGWLWGPRRFRFIGCCYDPGARSRYWTQARAADWWDVFIHYRTTRPTTVLPWNYPTEF